jgi:hypothetical protein
VKQLAPPSDAMASVETAEIGLVALHIAEIGLVGLCTAAGKGIPADIAP